MMNEKSTEALTNELKSLKSEQDLNKWLLDNKIGNMRFCDYFNELCAAKGMKLGDLESRVALSKAYIYACGNGTKNAPGKDVVIKLALGLGADLEETNRLLKLSGHKELYSKNEEDAIVSFGIERKLCVYDIDELLRKRGLKLVLTDR